MQVAFIVIVQRSALLAKAFFILHRTVQPSGVSDVNNMAIWPRLLSRYLPQALLSYCGVAGALRRALYPGLDLLTNHAILQQGITM